jgi:hypothetical protein
MRAVKKENDGMFVSATELLVGRSRSTLRLML